MNWQIVFFDESKYNCSLCEFKKIIVQYLLCVKFNKCPRIPKFVNFEIFDYMFFNFLLNEKCNLCNI